MRIGGRQAVQQKEFGTIVSKSSNVVLCQLTGILVFLPYAYYWAGGGGGPGGLTQGVLIFFNAR